MLFSAFGISFILTLTLATQAEGSILEKKWEEDRTKIADSEQIKPQTQVTKPVRVYVDVVADLMHAGHVEFFKKAKSLGDLSRIRAATADVIERINGHLGPSLGFQTTKDTMTNEPAVVNFVSRNVSPALLPPNQRVPDRLQGPDGL